MRHPRRTLLMTLVEERSALQAMIEAIEEYEASRMRRKLVLQAISRPERPFRCSRPSAPRRRR
jgi:hypothetical protein